MIVKNLMTAAMFVAVFGCTIRFDWPDHRVEVALLAEREMMQTVTVDGTELRVDSVEVSIIASELVSCQADDARRRDLPGFASLQPSLAWAHVEPTSTIDATPRVARALAHEHDVIALLRPPPDRYCAIVIELGPLPLEDAAMSETTTRITGEMRAVDAADWTPFHWRTGARATIRLDFEKPLDLGSRSEEVRLDVQPNLVQWFEPIERDLPDDEAAYRALTAAVTAAECAR